MARRSEEVAGAARYLEGEGMTKEELSSLHHRSLKDGTTTFPEIVNYFKRSNELEEANVRFAERICYVAEQRRSGNDKPFAILVHQALAKWPR
jgi:Asp-tRNA(Asn)/Glu-tRNA(Gln) amidotransferase C subunit